MKRRKYLTPILVLLLVLIGLLMVAFTPIKTAVCSAIHCDEKTTITTTTTTTKTDTKTLCIIIKTDTYTTTTTTWTTVTLS